MNSILLDTCSMKLLSLVLMQWVLFCFQKSLLPPLPPDVVVSFYIQAQKLFFAVYLLSQTQGNVKFDVFQAECTIPWLSEAILLYSDALQLCQQLKDKVDMQFWMIFSISQFEFFVC